ncbi:hypothetical protein [Thalassotalea profundi]|uniref:ABC transporter permease n=1 Tax=Thalassotalea profundi TaxID=2036687 RepID=A0ABQ3ICM8_9GAMM|nr:hypothetical protein [Thalassotalea profundi]GHE76781.1 hypothetical protein GCM10011501_00120 [Thalassotalea profundi]
MDMKLVIDLSVSWFKQTCKSYRFLLILVLLAFPIALLIHFKLIQQSYLSASFLGLNNKSPIVNAMLYDEHKGQALEDYLSDAIVDKWPELTVSYERTISLSTDLHGDTKTQNISFFSGGYSLLGLKPAFGSFSQLEFPVAGAELVAAISHTYFINNFSSRVEALNTKIIINGQAVTIVAVMPKAFSSFRKNRSTQLVMPYSQLAPILNQSQSSISPDTTSYLIGPIKNIERLEKSMTQYLKDEILILDESSLILNKAIGVNSNEYVTVSKRVSLLSLLFSILLIFSFIAFIAFISGENNKKQQEFLVRSYCGASSKQLLLQRLIDVIYTLVAVVFICGIILPLVKDFMIILLPQMQGVKVSWQSEFVLSIIWCFLGGFLFLTALIFFLQEKFIKTHVGRGESASLSVKMQSYFLLSCLLSLTLIVLYVAVLLVKSQIALYKTDLGFSANNRFVASFDFPITSSKKFMADQSAKILMSELNNVPEFLNVALTTAPPLSGRVSYEQWLTPTNKKVGVGEDSNTKVNIISPHYFKALNIPINQGQTLSWRSPFEVVVNQKLWDSYFAGESLAGAKLNKVYSPGNQKVASKIVGVVANELTQGPDSPAEPIVYQPIIVLTGLESIIIETSLSLKQITSIITQIMSSINTQFTNIKVTSLSALIEKENKPRVVLMTVALLSAVIILMSSMIFFLVTISQLCEKNAREYAVRFCAGAKTTSLIINELVIFVFMLLPTLLTFLAGFYYFSDLLSAHLVQVALFDYAVMIVLLMLFVSTLITVFYLNVHRKVRQAWRYLS